ncbi:MULTISPECIES: R3H domain-containing nucleic acid-binding protein [Cyanophyceae]|uniref:R3H domain-containing nucleic acid-binding protein n=1 Tax=Cyanophyceae TaxID=3028117 RepID=UPI00168312C3|nr:MULTISPECIES: R3H domain-containing nucleic acid-binding protein [unclassified Phormidium]MBD1916042.1 AAA family ATPase [Phormidium sp. FACHB-77]MBD2031689.1 AAA family ATPase [Phormidium sp. FACHB-322]MBD2052684.1 AAA family ATPase [Leptolyngbya sp. FACHB-60]
MPIDDLEQILSILPPSIRAQLLHHPQRQSLIEVVLDLGRLPEARFFGSVEYLSEEPVTHADLDHCIKRVGIFGGDNRAGIEKTLHRISAIRNRSGEVIGLTCRVGRAIFGTIGMIRDLVETGRSILMLGRPGVGKTTALREIARVLADDLQKRVVIIDTSNEIAGDGDIPHPAIGRARRMQVARPEEQHRVMIEAVENHMPEVIVIDEIGTELEALAARTIAERGVQLVGTAHGNQLENLIKNPTLSDLIGGIQSVTLGDEEARRRGSQKSVLERKAPPTFDIAVEMLERQRWAIHEDVTVTIDNLLRGRQPGLQIRTVDENQKVIITHELPGSGREVAKPSRSGMGWRAAGQMVPPTNAAIAQRTTGNSNNVRPLGKVYSQEPTTDPMFAHLLETIPDDDIIGPNGEDAMRLYPYGLSRYQIERVIQTLHMPVVITKDLDNADAVIALRSHAKAQAKLKHMAQGRQIPVHLVKSNSIPQITRALQRLLDMDDNPAAIDLELFSHSGGDDELEALEEARLAVEQIVIPKGQPVELLPRSAHIRKMQHELAEHYRLKSLSCGEEPNRRLRIYPA